MSVRGSLYGGKETFRWDESSRGREDSRRVERRTKEGVKAMNTKDALLMPSGRVTAILGWLLITERFSTAGLLRESFPVERKLARTEARKRRRRRRRRRPNGGYPGNGARPAAIIIIVNAKLRQPVAPPLQEQAMNFFFFFFFFIGSKNDNIALLQFGYYSFIQFERGIGLECVWVWICSLNPWESFDSKCNLEYVSLMLEHGDFN